MENTLAHMATWIIASLHDQQFASLAVLKVAMARRIEANNRKSFQKHAGARVSASAAEEQPLLQPLPAAPYEITWWVSKHGRMPSSWPFPNFREGAREPSTQPIPPNRNLHSRQDCGRGCIELLD